MPGSSPVVLAVDDDPLNLIIIEELLGEFYSVITASTGAQALRSVAEKRPEIVLLDVVMPDMDGYEVCRRIRSSPAGEVPKIILVSSCALTDERLTGYEAGADDYISKPFDRLELLAKIRVFLRLCSVETLVAERTRANSALKEALAEAQRARATKSEFLANMSHEIRTPMTAILGFAEILRERVCDPENIEVVHTVIDNGKYLLGLLNDILDLAKVESGKLQFEYCRVSPFKILRAVEQIMAVRAAEKGLDFSVRAEGELPETIATDPTRLRQVLLNILGNAIKFTAAGCVEVVAQIHGRCSDDPRIAFTVKDTGIGMTAEQLENVFQPFTQADATTTRLYGGTGLGLSISSALVKMLGGEIRMSSQAGVGSTVQVSVTTGMLQGIDFLTEAEYQARTSRDATAQRSRSNPSIPARLLLVEDSPVSQRLMMHVFSKAGAKVALASNGQQALDALDHAREEGESFDLIVMDMQMPVMDGFEATRRMRAQGERAPIIALTANAMMGCREECLAAGCTDFATKPIQRHALLEMLQGYLYAQADHAACTAGLR